MKSVYILVQPKDSPGEYASDVTATSSRRHNTVISVLSLSEYKRCMLPMYDNCMVFVFRILDHPRSFAGNDSVKKSDPAIEAEKLEYCAPEVIQKKLPGPPFDIWWETPFLLSLIVTRGWDKGYPWMFSQIQSKLVTYKPVISNYLFMTSTLQVLSPVPNGSR